MNARLHLAALALVAGAAAAASDPLDGLQYADGKSHDRDLRGEAVYVVYFCAH